MRNVAAQSNVVEIGVEVTAHFSKLQEEPHLAGESSDILPYNFREFR